jgi:hypothetical protein
VTPAGARVVRSKIARMRASGRVWTLLLMLYIFGDVLDPSVPGIFFFESDQLFIDGVVDHAKHRSAGDVWAEASAPLPVASVSSPSAHAVQTAPMPRAPRTVTWHRHTARDRLSALASSDDH